MADQESTIVTPPADADTAPPPSLPDLNVGKYDWNFVQELVDRAAWINMFAVPERSAPGNSSSSTQSTGGVTEAALHRFRVEMDNPGLASGIKATNTVGQRAGNVHLRWSYISDDAQVRPGQEPAAIPLDPARSQRLLLQEACFAFGGGEDGFSGFGSGRVFPDHSAGEVRLHVMAVGNISAGVGKFSGLEGNFVFAGRLTEDGDLAGAILVRVVDALGILKATEPLDPFVPESDPRSVVPDMTYLLYDTRKSGPEQRTTFNIGPQGQIRGIVIPQQYRTVHLDFSTGPRGFSNEIVVGTDVIGDEISFSAIDPTHPGPPGTADSPATFQGLGAYVFRDQEGSEVGAITPQFLEGRTFAMVLAGAPDQIAARFGCLGPILEGDGYFGQVQGYLVALAGVALLPHLFNCRQLAYLKDADSNFLIR
jgi:hypothetical protein